MLGGVDVLTSTLDQLREAHEEVATLDEAFEAAEGLSGINLELKPPIPVIESFLNRLMTSCSSWPRGLLLSSFFIPLIEQVRTIWPDVETGILSGASYDPHGRVALDAAASLNCAIVLPEHPSISERLIEDAHGAGRRVITWTVNDPARVRVLAESGIDGIITDDIARTRAAVGPI
jgi:glycerophosphoryl diester phosphodiesterase